ncbi:hypothetical protein L228DRAFT_12953 [Xylona heveae TC161]|uniref:Uncharacterized protein n=1 Tax=Xylona heveae (strain CBS 132557 / TC161) TaxID=1328760 RepID=A0A165JNN4_XYLHT|nr:hypothetical protein L228DRAFT_12953 [Xylona heveae TC161]KZF26459.1 hypothetical protein L228DRAFT_12953 [Xylona heveae TC161]
MACWCCCALVIQGRFILFCYLENYPIAGINQVLDYTSSVLCIRGGFVSGELCFFFFFFFLPDIPPLSFHLQIANCPGNLGLCNYGHNSILKENSIALISFYIT